MDESEQDVLGADVVVVEQAGFFLRKHDDPTGPVSESFEQGNCLPTRDSGPECIGGLVQRTAPGFAPSDVSGCPYRPFPAISQHERSDPGPIGAERATVTTRTVFEIRRGAPNVRAWPPPARSSIPRSCRQIWVGSK